MMLRATSTAADSAITESSGCTLTFPGLDGVTAQIVVLKIFHGPSATAANGAVHITGLAIGDFDIHFVQSPTATSFVDLIFDFSAMPASGLNTPITIAVPALLGAGETTVLLTGSYFES